MHEGILFVVSVPTNGSNVAFNVVIWRLFLSIKFSSQRSTFSGWHLNDKPVKKVEKGLLHIAVDYKGDAAASEAELRHDFRLSGTIYPLQCLESEGESQQSFILQQVVRGLRKESIEQETF